MLGDSQEWLGIQAQQRSVTFADVILQLTLDGPNHSTIAVDLSPIGAPITFHGGAEISTTIIQNGGAALKLVNQATDYISAPHHVAYDNLWNGNFTIEWWHQIQASYVLHQWFGVWDDNDIAGQVWRIVADSDRMFFQYVQGGVVKSITHVHPRYGLNTNYYQAVQRYGDKLTVYFGNMFVSDAIVEYQATISLGGLDTPSINSPLRIGLGFQGLLQLIRITKGAWYPNAPAIPMFPLLGQWGKISPPLVVDTDQIFAPRVGLRQLFPPLVIDADQIFTPTVKYNQVIRPPLVVDQDLFFIPPGFSTGPTFPKVTGGSFPYRVSDSGTWKGVVAQNTATIPLPASLVNGNLLVAFIHSAKPLKTFSLGGAINGWHLTQADQCGNGAWAFRIVDGTETPPTFNWNGSPSMWFGKVLQIGNLIPVVEIGGNPQFFFIDFNLTCGSGTHLLMPQQFSAGFFSCLTMGIFLVNNDQVIPPPPDFYSMSQFNDPEGSHLVCGYNAAPNNRGCGNIDLTIPSTPNWTAFLMTLLGPEHL